MVKRKFVVALLASAGLAVLPSAVHAETAADGAEKPALSEIVVTADKSGTKAVQAGSFRGALAIDTPLTVSVISEQVLKSQQALSLLDALRNTPGVTSSQTNPSVYNNLSIRGIPVENRGNFRLNGSLPINNLIDLPLENKVRVEALKGASALYYGFTTPSGIINLTTKRPTADPLFIAEMNANSHGQMQGHIDAGGTAGILGVRVNAVYGGVDNGIDNTRGWRSFISGAADLRPLDGLILSLDVEQIHKDVTEPTILMGPSAAASLLTVLPQIPSMSTNPGGVGFMNKAAETNLLGRIAYKISPAWSVSAEGGFSYATRDRRFSTLSNFNPVTGNGVLSLTASDGSQYRNKNVRGEIAGTFETFGLIHELLVGASKNTREQYSAPALTVASTAAAASSSTVGIPRNNCVALGLPITCVQNAYNPIQLADIQYNGISPYAPSRDTAIHDGGLYLFDRIHFGGPRDDLISLLGGVRKSYYKETAQGPSTTVYAPYTTFSANPVSFSGGVVVKPMAWLSAYGTYIEGLESTPAAPITAVNYGQSFPATNSKQYEGGIKIEPKHGLLITGAYFSIDRALTYTDPATLIYTQDGRATYKGLELSATGNVTRDLSIYASALFLKAKQGKTADATLIGKDIENTAKRQWSLSADYKLTPLMKGLSITGGAFFTGARAINPQNTLYLPGYTLFDVGGSYEFKLAGVDMTARVYAQNVTGKRYFAATGGNYISWGVPPTIKFSLTAKIL